jgi:extracellular elastinolytic metalloproteinase
VPDTRATHVALRVVTNQCTGGPVFQGDTDNDPLNNPDCDEGDAGPLLPLQGNNVRAAELQVFSR